MVLESQGMLVVAGTSNTASNGPEIDLAEYATGSKF
jgi:hypothetical protein